MPLPPHPRTALRARWAAVALATAGCGVDVAAEMERALLHTSDALAVALVASDPLLYGYSGAPGLRHNTEGDCPELITDDTVPTSFTAELDYNDGCQPKSGLVPAVIRGVGGISREGDTVTSTLDGLDVHLAFPLSGATESTSGPPILAVTGEVTVSDGDRELVARLDLHLGDADTATLDGDVVLSGADGSATVRFADAVLPWTTISGECPRPTRGRAVLVEDPELVVDFAAGDDDRVMVTRRSRESELVDLCAYESWVFGGDR